MALTETDQSAVGSLGTRLGRRSFLGRLFVGLGASAVLSLPGVRWAAAGTLANTRTAYRLSSHGRRVCSACKAHDANRFYRTLRSANRCRAHPGCNCGIVTQDLPKGLWICYFRGGRTNVYDLRWPRPKCPPP
jgi:hypothetical protein